MEVQPIQPPGGIPSAPGIAAPPSSGNPYPTLQALFVSPKGSDTHGDGSITKPFLSPQKAANLAKPGTVVYFRGGTYYPPPGENNRLLKLKNLHGTAQDRIYFAPYGGEPVVFDGRVGMGNMVAVEVIDCSYLTLWGFDIQYWRFAGIDVFASQRGACHDILIEGQHVHDKHANNVNWGYGIRAKGPCQQITIRGNYVHHWSAGIALWESPEQNALSCFVPPRKGNTAPGSPPGGYLMDLPESEWAAWPGWIEIAPRGCVIEENLCHNNTSVAGPQNADNFVTRYCIDCIVRNNIGFNDWSGASETIDDNFDMAGATRLEFSGNIAFNCTYRPPYPPTTGSGNGIKIGVRGALAPLVFNNFSFYNYRMGLDMAYSVWPRVYHNTIYRHSSAPEGHHKGGDYGMFFEGKSNSKGVDCRNNIVYRSRQADIGAQHWVHLEKMDYNCVEAKPLGNYGCLQEPHSLQTNPLFLNPYHQFDTNFPADMPLATRMKRIREEVRERFGLQPSSPCRGAGVFIQGITPAGMAAAVNMGAF